MINKIIEYIPSIAMFGLIWAVFQFYQKRSDERKDKKRQDGILHYKELYSILKEIEFDLNKFISNSNIDVINYTKDLTALLNDIKLEGFKIKEFINKKNLLSNEEELNFIKDKITEHSKMLEEKSLKREAFIEKLVVKNKSTLLGFVSKLETKIEELNKVCTLSVHNTMKLDYEINKLTVDTNSLIEFYRTENHTGLYGVINVKLIDKMRKLYNETISLKNIINQELG